MSRFDDAIAAIDALHAQDPELDEGTPAELRYAQQMTEALRELAPHASEALRIAVRAQHLERWALPRATYPDGKAGYLRWRTEQQKRHASRAAEVLHDVGVDEETIERVSGLIRKRNVARDEEAQLLEDAACLVFLRTRLESFAEGRDEAQIVDILRKTWAKMGPRGRAVASETNAVPTSLKGVFDAALG